MSEVHYFPRYSQPENFVTNNTLLLLLRLREYSLLKFEKFMARLCGDKEVQFAPSWFRFAQQIGTGESVVDGFIGQDSVKIAVETKRADAFDHAQLEAHLKIFGGEQHKLLILLTRSKDEAYNQRLAQVRGYAAEGSIQVLHATFENIITKAEECLSPHDEEMIALVDDYEAFCSEMELLPRDKYMLFVPPCRQSFRENKEFHLYYCPATRSIRKATYLGIYKEKSVRLIGRIAKVVACSVDLNTPRVTIAPQIQALTAEEEQRVVGAAEAAVFHGWSIQTGHKFYLCDEMQETDFRKTTPGGIMGHCYFDLEMVLGGSIPDSLSELAERLRGRTWE